MLSVFFLHERTLEIGPGEKPGTLMTYEVVTDELNILLVVDPNTVTLASLKLRVPQFDAAAAKVGDRVIAYSVHDQKGKMIVDLGPEYNFPVKNEEDDHDLRAADMLSEGGCCMYPQHFNETGQRIARSHVSTPSVVMAMADIANDPIDPGCLIMDWEGPGPFLHPFPI